MTQLRFGSLFFIATFLLSSAWAFLVPLRAQADETAHATYAAGVVRGQFITEGVPGIYAGTGAPFIEHKVLVPDGFLDVQNGASCILTHPENSEHCVIPIPQSTSSTFVFTTAANYPPPYYLLVGWPTLIFDGNIAWYLMRLMTALVCSLVLTGAALVLRRGFGTQMAVLAPLALTPTALSYFGAINPAGLEIVSCLALASCLAALTIPDKWNPNLFLWSGLSVTLSTLTRPGAMIWVAIIVCIFAIATSKARWKEFFSHRNFWYCLALSAFGCLLSLLWNHFARPGDSVIGWPDPTMSFTTMVHILRERMPISWESIVGNFGWVDNPVPWYLSVIAALYFATLVTSSMIASPWRIKLAGVAGLVAIPSSMLLIQYSVLPTAGIMWQGRYWLPLIATLIVLFTTSAITFMGSSSQLRTVLISLFAAMHILMFVRVVYRYSSGIGHVFLWSNLSPRHIVASSLFIIGSALFVCLVLTAKNGKNSLSLLKAGSIE